MTMAKKSAWKAIRAKLASCSERDLLNLIGELYALNKANQYFLEARFMAATNQDLTAYKALIQRGVAPAPPKPFNLTLARKAIKDYEKATGNLEGTLDSMVYYVESGIQFSKDHGDIHDYLYGSLITMFKAILKKLAGLAPSASKAWLSRLAKLVSQTSTLSYHEPLADAFLQVGFEKVVPQVVLRCYCHRDSL